VRVTPKICCCAVGLLASLFGGETCGARVAENSAGNADLDGRRAWAICSTSTRRCGILDAYGLILTSPRGPGFFEGKLEFVDVVPAWVLTQKTNTA